MTRRLRIFVGIALSLTSTAPASADSELVLNQSIKPSAVGYYDHHVGVVLAEGFWAQAGADVTVTAHTAAGFYLDKTPLDAAAQQYTTTVGRTYIIAGCVPLHLPYPGGAAGSVWVACNDLDYVKDKVVESPFISCVSSDKRNGVLQELFIKEINNRTWQSFRFSCGDMKPDGIVAPQLDKAPFLFNLTREGTLYATSTPSGHLTLGIFEVENQLQLKQSLLSVGLEHQTADAVYEAGMKGQRTDDIKVTPRIPPNNTHLLAIHSWDCPPGMVVTGAAIGHIPDNNGKDSRPVYILAECRRLLHNP